MKEQKTTRDRGVRAAESYVKNTYFLQPFDCDNQKISDKDNDYSLENVTNCCSFLTSLMGFWDLINIILNPSRQN